MKQAATGRKKSTDRPPWPRTLAVLGIMAACFSFQEMAILPSLPIIQRHLSGASTTTSALLESGFLIVSAVAAPLLGKLGDTRGKKRMLLVTLGFYFIGSVGAGLAPNFIALILLRALQGVGGALMVLSIAITRDALPEDKLSFGIGCVVGSFGAGACLGLAMSGIITEKLSWRFIFFAESVLITIGAILVAKFLPGSSPRGEQRIDYPGVALLGAALASLIMGVTEALNLGWPVAGIFLLSVVLFITWGIYESRVDEPLLDTKVLRSPRVLFPIVGSALAGYAAFSAMFLVPRFVQVPRHLPKHIAQQLSYGFNAGIADVGLYLLPLGVGILCAGPVSGPLGRRYGGKWIFTGGLLLTALASALLALFHGNNILFSVWLFLLGAGFSMTFGAGSVFVIETVDISNTGIANAFLSLTRLITGGIGAQIAAALILSQSVGGSNHAPHESTFAIAFGVSAFVALIGAGFALLVPTDESEEASESGDTSG
jgi:MFS family permease